MEPRDVAALSVAEIREHAPLVHKAIQDEATEPLTVKIGEMDGAIASMKPDVDVLAEIKKLLNLAEGENPVEKLTNFLQAVEDSARAGIKDYVNELVSKKVKTERGQAVLRRLIGEQESSGFAFSSQYDGDLSDDLKKKIKTEFDAKVEGDEDIKAVVGEMFTGADDDDEGERGGTGGSGLGGRSRVGSGHGRNDKAETRGSLKVVKRKLSEVN